MHRVYWESMCRIPCKKKSLRRAILIFFIAFFPIEEIILILRLGYKLQDRNQFC